MTASCPRCHRTDGDWKKALRVLAVVGRPGERIDVWRHRPCGYLLACVAEAICA